MANELLDVVPKVQSMPTTGWFCQTGGNARRRITRNTSGYKQGKLDIEGTFDVAGVPGHTHNANAVVSIDANYSKFRTTQIVVPAQVWSSEEMKLPEGLLTDSEEPDNATERYERAIERCVGYTGLFPENCTGHIREPTRSIGEIRTLVAPKHRLDTLTYVEERGGWRVPKDADDVKEESTRDVLVSDFPDVYIDVRPLATIEKATIDLDVSPSSLFIESSTHRYLIAGGRPNDRITTAASDMTLRFVWDDDERLYRTLSEKTFIIATAVEVLRTTGAATAAQPYDAGGGNNPRLTVTFPIIKTSKAFDGFCWLGTMRNEEALNYATRTGGATIAPRIDVEVLGILNHPGPFKWVGIPAYRIPIGSRYALPAVGVMQENINVYNFWDKMSMFEPAQFSRYYALQVANAALLANAVGVPAIAAATANILTAGTFDLPARAGVGGAYTQNSGLQMPMREGVGQSILGQLRDLVPYSRAAGDYPDFTAYIEPYSVAYGGLHIPETSVVMSAIRRSRLTRAVPAAVPAPANANHADVFPDGASLNPQYPYTLKHSIEFEFPATILNPGVVAAFQQVRDIDPLVGLLSNTKDAYCVFAATPLITEVDQHGVGDWTGEPEFLSTVLFGNRVRVPLVIADASQRTDRFCTVNYDLDSTLTTTRAHRVINGDLEDNTDVAPYQLGKRFFIEGWTMWVHPQDGPKSNFIGAHFPPETAQVMRNFWGDAFAFGHTFQVAEGLQALDGAPQNVGATLLVPDYYFATAYTGPVFFENDGKLFYTASASNRQTRLYYHSVANAPNGIFDYGAVGTVFYNIFLYDNAAGAARPAVAADFDVGLVMEMTLLGKDWSEAFGTTPETSAFKELLTASNARGAVFQSIKRISQHVCAPVLNPNLRIGSTAPLNYNTRHLPPEMRDFRLQLQDIDWGRLRTDRVTINELTLYEFKDGNQAVGAEQNIMYLPQFRENKQAVTTGAFDITVFSELGCPSYFCFFLRSAATDILQQPLIKELSIRCETTKKKSNTISNASVGQLYHLTQRNVHPAAEYDRAAFNRRQTILLSAEDVGLMGITKYQAAKRVRYNFTGTCDRPGNLYVVFAYNNRGLHIDGRRLHVVTLHE